MFPTIACISIFGQNPTTPPPAPAPDKIVITVNGHAITAKEVDAYLWDWKVAEIAQALTVSELVREEAAKQSVTASADEIHARTEMQIQQVLTRMPKGTSETDALKQSHVSRSQIELGAKISILIEKLAQKTFTAADYVRVETFVIRSKPDNAADMQASLAKANEAYAALQKGDLWEKVLPTYASDAQNVPNNGELGYVKLSDFPEAAKTELQTLKIGGYTKPVQTQNGVQIFKLENRGQNATPSELTSAKAHYLPAMERTIVERLQKEAKIVNAF